VRGLHSVLGLAFVLFSVAAAALLALPDIRHFRQARLDAPVA
jgi:hypothetical protein